MKKLSIALGLVSALGASKSHAYITASCCENAYTCCTDTSLGQNDFSNQWVSDSDCSSAGGGAHQDEFCGSNSTVFNHDSQLLSDVCWNACSGSPVLGPTEEKIEKEKRRKMK